MPTSRPMSAKKWGVVLATLSLILATTGTALAANPGTGVTTTNQDFSVEIMLDPDPGSATHWLGEPLEVDAWATLGTGDLANVMYLLDVSGSMENNAANPPQDINPPAGIGPEDDCNGDGLDGTALDSACFGLIALNSSLGDSPNVDVGMVAFGSDAKTADMDPAIGSQAFTSPPDADNDSAGGSDVEQVIRSTDTEFGGSFTAGIGLFTSDMTAGFAGSTNYDAALTAMNVAFATQPAAEVNRAIFISDGLPLQFTTGPGSPLGSAAPSTVIDTFAIGPIAVGACSGSQPLQVIATTTGGTCTEVADPSTLSSVLPVALTNIATLELLVNGQLVASTSGSEPVSMHVEDIDISTVVVPGANLIEAVATAEDGTVVIADRVVEVIGMTLTPPHAVNELSIDNEHSVLATLLGSPGEISGRAVTFNVGGQNPSGPSVLVTDAAGAATFSYTVPVEPESLGLDTISAAVTIDGHTVVLEVANEWVDTTPPVAACLETHNPSGKNIPRSPGKGGQAQNPDGFYELSADDAVFGPQGLEVFVTDTGSGTTFGPFAVGTKIKYIEAGGATPSIKMMAANNGNGSGGATAVDYQIKGRGDAALTAVDGSGNISDPVSCLVPRPPK